MKSPALIAQGWQLARATACCSPWRAASLGLAVRPTSCKKPAFWGPSALGLLWAGDRWGHPASGHTFGQGRTPRRCVGFITTHLLLHARLGFLLQLRCLGLLLRLPHELLDEPPGDDRQEQRGGRRGRPPVLVPYLQEQRLGYGARRGDGTPGKASPAGTLAARAAEHQHPALPAGPAVGILQVAVGHP